MAAHVGQYETSNLGGIPKLVIIWYRSRYRDNCFYCGCLLDASNRSKDHVVPRSTGCPPRKNNIVPCCKKCNVSKGSLQVKHFRGKIKGMLSSGMFYGERLYISKS